MRAKGQKHQLSHLIVLFVLSVIPTSIPASSGFARGHHSHTRPSLTFYFPSLLPFVYLHFNQHLDNTAQFVDTFPLNSLINSHPLQLSPASEFLTNTTLECPLFISVAGQTFRRPLGLSPRGSRHLHTARPFSPLKAPHHPPHPPPAQNSAIPFHPSLPPLLLLHLHPPHPKTAPSVHTATKTPLSTRKSSSPPSP